SSVGPVFVAVLSVQAALVSSLLVLLRRACRTADAGVEERAGTERAAAGLAAPRAQERQHPRGPPASGAGALTGGAAGGVGSGSPVLRMQARRDLEVVEQIQTPAGPDGDVPADLDRWLAPVLVAAEPAVTVDATIAPAAVPDRVGAALAGAVAEAL